MKKTLWIAAWLLCGLFTVSYLQAKTKVACVGNSITFGYGLKSTESYPTKLQSLLGTEYSVSNFGVSGRTLLKKGDKPYWNESAYTQALNSSPNIVIIMLGTNDSKTAIWGKYADEYIPDYTDLIASFKNLSSKPQVYICLLPPANHTKWDIRQSVILNEINPKITEIAISQGVNLIDINAVFQNKTGLLLSDNVHPNAKGATKIAEKMHASITVSAPRLANISNNVVVASGYAFYWYKNSIFLGEDKKEQSMEVSLPLPANYQALVKMYPSSNDLVLSNTLYVEELATSTNKNVTGDTYVYYNSKKNGITVYTGEASADTATFRLFNIRGQLIETQQINKANAFINTHALHRGMYVYQLSTHNKVQSGSLLVH